MNVFKMDRYYLAMLIIALICMAAVFGIVYRAYPAGRVELFLFGSVIVILALIVLYSVTVKVGLEEGILSKRSLFGFKSLRIRDIADISVMDMRGRYILLVITADKFILLSSLLGHFPDLFHAVRAAVPEEPRNKINHITDDLFRRKTLVMRIFTTLIALLAMISAVYYYARF